MKLKKKIKKTFLTIMYFEIQIIDSPESVKMVMLLHCSFHHPTSVVPKKIRHPTRMQPQKCAVFNDDLF